MYTLSEEEWECVRVCVANAPIPYDITKKKIPADILAKIGGAGRFELPKLSKDVINLERVESDKIIIEEKGDLVLSPNCPACRYDYGTGTLQMCPECGASRPMVKS